MFITDVTTVRLAPLRSEVDEPFIFERRPSPSTSLGADVCEGACPERGRRPSRRVEKPDAVRSRLSTIDRWWIARTRTCLHQIGSTPVLVSNEVLRELNMLSDRHG